MSDEIPAGQAGHPKGVMQYFRFANWERHQHYRERRPPWFKVYTAILEPGNDCYGMPDHQVGQLVKLLALAADMGNCIPFDDNFVTSQINASEKVILKVFHNLGIISVHDTRAEVFEIESNRLASINASKSASNSASGNASNVASESARLREQRTEYRDQRQRKSSCSGSGVSSGRDFGTNTERCRETLLATAGSALRDDFFGPDQEPDPNHAEPAPDTAGTPPTRPRARATGDEWRQWASDLERDSDDEPGLVRAYVAALDEAIAARYAEAGGRFTPARRARLVSRLAGREPDVQLLAIEVYVDRFAAAKDERYLLGIATRLGSMSLEEFAAEADRHRLAMAGAGLADHVAAQLEGGA